MVQKSAIGSSVVVAVVAVVVVVVGGERGGGGRVSAEDVVLSIQVSTSSSSCHSGVVPMDVLKYGILFVFFVNVFVKFCWDGDERCRRVEVGGAGMWF